MDPAADDNLVSSEDAVDPRNELVPGFRSASVCLDASFVLGMGRLFRPICCDVLVAFSAHGAAVTAGEAEGLDAHGAGVLDGPEEGMAGMDEGLGAVVVGMPVGEIWDSEVSVIA